MENNLATIKQVEIAPFSERIADVTILANELEIKDKQTQQNGERLLKTIQGLKKDIEEKQKDIVSTPKIFIQAVKEMVDTLLPELEDAKTVLCEKLLERDKLTDDVKGVTELDKVEIIDANAVPIEFCTPDMVKIRQAIKAGIEVPGVKVSKYKLVK